MKYFSKILLTCLLYNNCLYSLKILLTTALTPAHFNFRRAQYIKSFKQLAKFGYGPDKLYIVEAIKKQCPSFLDKYSNYVFYATTNNPSLKNHGINEAITMLEAINHFNFKSEEMIIKLTGRHHFIDDTFIKTVEDHQSYDAIVKISTEGYVFCVSFGMKCKHLIEMIQSFNLSEMENKFIPLEWAMAYYLNKKIEEGNFKVFYVNSLRLFINIFGSSTWPGAPETYLIY